MVSYYKLQLSLTMLIMYDTRHMILVNSPRFIGVGLMASTIRLNHVVYSSFLEGKIDKSICKYVHKVPNIPKGTFCTINMHVEYILLDFPLKVCIN